MQTAQVMDSLVAFACGSSWALELVPRARLITWAEASCGDAVTCTPFADVAGDDDALPGGFKLVLTLGYALSFVCLMPLGLVTLDENMPFQVASFAATVVGIVVFMVAFARDGFVDARVPACGGEYSNLIGVILFNFAFCVTMPSLLNEMKPGVRIAPVIWSTVLGSALTYIVVGLMGGLAFSAVGVNMLTTLTSRSQPGWVRVTAYVFEYIVIGLGIPIFCVYAKYNLAASRRCSPRVATLLGVILPWAVSWTLYLGDGVMVFVNWSGMFVNGFCDFLAPLSVAAAAAGIAFSCTGLHDALFAVGKSPPNTVLDPLPGPLRPYQRNLIVLTLLLVVPVLVFAVVSQFVTV